jgi:leucyl aminopeptidase
MPGPIPIRFEAPDPDRLATAPGRVAVIVAPDGRMDAAARRADRLTRGALKRLAGGDGFAKAKPGEAITLAWPAGMAAAALDVVILPPRPTAAEARKAGATLAGLADGKPLLVAAGGRPRMADLACGLALAAYRFECHKTADPTPPAEVVIAHSRPDDLAAAYAPLAAAVSGVHLARDLTNEPANVLTTTEFAARLSALSDLGLKVEVLDEAQLHDLGMRALLCVGQGSASPSHVVVMRWNGTGLPDAEAPAPLALIGKGVVFDTGGISLKPAAGMEDMTMDMGGAAVVAGTMQALALRRAPAHVVGLVGLVENMPSGTATRPGDVIASMKGDTIEVNNTDAEGRLVLCDVMWYAQQRFEPAAMIDLATLTGAAIVALGNEKAAVFSNDDGLCNAFLKAAEAEEEGAWRMPLGAAYEELLKSRIADVKNSGGRPAGSITGAQFLARFVREGMAWIHLDIAGVASVKTATAFAPKGATGWGVRALDRLVRARFQG